MSDHTTNRLTVEDYARIDDAIAAYAAHSTGVIHSERFTTAGRIAHHAIRTERHGRRRLWATAACASGR